MKLCAIDETKVEILIEKEDATIFDMPYERFFQGDSKTNDFFCEIIEMVALKTGIKFLNSKVLVEVFPAEDESYYIVLTKINCEQSAQNEDISGDESSMFIYRIYSLYDMFKIAGCFNNYKSILPV